MSLFSHGPLIGPDQTWALWAILAIAAALAIYLEQKYHWANKVTGCIIALVIMLILSNIGIIPTEAPVYDNVWGYVVPLAVPMLLFKADMKRIGKESGKILGIYMISSVGTILGGLLAYFLLKNAIPRLADITPMFVGTYTGGSVNFVAMSDSFKVPGKTVSAALVADNLLMALYFFLLISIPTFSFIQKKFRHPYEDALNAQVGNGDEEETQAAKYWGGKEISLKDIAMVVATAFTIVAVSDALANLFGSIIPDSNNVVMVIIKGLLSNKYLIITTATMILASLFPKYFDSLSGAQEIGTFLIYLFFAVIGAPASIPMIIMNAPLLLVFAAIIVLTNLVITMIFGKLFKFSIEEILVASNANVGGPTTAAAMAVSKGWVELIVPALLVGTLGYVLGNYYGILVGSILH